MADLINMPEKIRQDMASRVAYAVALVWARAEGVIPADADPVVEMARYAKQTDGRQLTWAPFGGPATHHFAFTAAETWNLRHPDYPLQQLMLDLTLGTFPDQDVVAAVASLNRKHHAALPPLMIAVREELARMPADGPPPGPDDIRTAPRLQARVMAQRSSGIVSVANRLAGPAHRFALLDKPMGIALDRLTAIHHMWSLGEQFDPRAATRLVMDRFWADAGLSPVSHSPGDGPPVFHDTAQLPAEFRDIADLRKIDEHAGSTEAAFEPEQVAQARAAVLRAVSRGRPFATAVEPVVERRVFREMDRLATARAKAHVLKVLKLDTLGQDYQKLFNRALTVFAGLPSPEAVLRLDAAVRTGVVADWAAKQPEKYRTAMDGVVRAVDTSRHMAPREARATGRARPRSLDQAFHDLVAAVQERTLKLAEKSFRGTLAARSLPAGTFVPEAVITHATDLRSEYLRATLTAPEPAISRTRTTPDTSSGPRRRTRRPAATQNPHAKGLGYTK